MKNFFLKIQTLALFILLTILFNKALAQYKTYELTDRGDTINAIDKKGIKQGKWIVKVGEIRGEPGYEEEGIFKNGKKEGFWRRYNVNGDIIAMENYKYGGKNGKQQYFTFMGDLVREENWHAFNPDAPYDTIPVYGTGSNEILSFKIVKSEQYSVKHGKWKFYEPSSGRLIRTEVYDRGHLQEPDKETTATTTEAPKKVKPKEVLEFEKINSKKKKVLLRQGQTGL